MSKHTPGPWLVDATGDGINIVQPVSEDQIAEVFGEQFPDEVEANAQLIAAAPDLLAALYLALPYVEVQDGDEHYKPGAVANTIKTMQAAIAKAEGR